MNRISNKIAKLFFLMLVALSVLNITSCDKVEDVTLDSGLQSISVTKMPDKIKYSRSDKVLDITGLEVTAHYRSGYSKLLDNSELTFSGFRSSEGYYTSSEVITITYTDKEGKNRQATFQITYADLANINISSQPEKTRYTQNSPFDFTGLIVNATYQDNSTQPVFSSSILEALRLITWGEKEETVLSEEEYAKIMNYRGRDENNNSVNLTIPLMYQTDEEGNFVKDGSGERILVSQLEIIGFDDTFYGFTEGQKQVLVKYTEFDDGYFPIEKETAFNVKLASLQGLTMTTSPYKSNYSSNSVLNFDGMTLRANYSDGSTETIFSHDIYNNLVLFEEKKEEIENFVGGAGKTLSIPLQWKTDSSGNIVYKDGDWCAAREIIFEDFNSVSHTGNQTVKVRYVDNWGNSEQEIETQFGIQYEVLQGIVINSEPSKRKYKRGDAFNFSGLNIKSQYTNGETDTLFSDNVYKNLTTLTAEDRLKIEAYTGRDGGSVVPLTIPLEWKRDTNGKIVTDGAGNNVALRELVFEGFDSSKIISSQEVIITLKDYSEGSALSKQTKIGIGYVDMAGIQISANPYKLKYSPKEPLDLSGIVLYAQYEDNSLEKLFDDEILKEIKEGLSVVQAKAIEDYKGDIKLGEGWFKQLDPRSEDTSNRMTIPLTWKKNSDGDFVNAAGEVIDASSEDKEKVCTSGIVVMGFDSTESAGSQNVRLRYVDNSGYGTFVKEVSFQISYKTLSSIQLTSLPEYKGTSNEPISFKDLAIKAQYSDGTVKEIFNQDIYDGLPADYKPASLGSKYDDKNPLEIILEKDKDGNVIRQIKFKGYDTTGDIPSQTQTITVTYEETSKAGPVSVYTQYQLRTDCLKSISVSLFKKKNYVMNGPSSETEVGGPRQGEGSRDGEGMACLDISEWHFNVDGMELLLSYNNGNAKKITFKNTNDNKCYGTGTRGTEPYVLDSNKNLLYMQRWAQEKDENGNRYKIKITGFDPVAALKSAKNTTPQQTLIISYTEGEGEREITVNTEITIQYFFETIFKPTEAPTYPYGDKDKSYFHLGDYPQSAKKESVVVSEYLKKNTGFFEYYLGSDGYLYCPKYINGVRKYFKVEPLSWHHIENTNYYTLRDIIDCTPYYTGKPGRQNKRTDEFKWVVDGRTTYGTVNSTYDIGNDSFIYSTLRNWLNGDNINGDSTYNGRGFVQTAFTALAQERLDPIAITEQFNTTVSGTANKVGDGDAISSTIAAYGDNFTLFENSNVKVIIPADYTTERVSRRYFDYDTTSGDIADRIKKPIVLYDYYNSFFFYNSVTCLEKFAYVPNMNLRIKDLIKAVYSIDSSDFAGNVTEVWLAGDVHTHPENSTLDGVKKSIRYSSSYTMDSSKDTKPKLSDSTSNFGVIPIVKITNFQ